MSDVVRRWAMAVLLLVPAGSAVADSASSGDSEPDWPTKIAELREQVDTLPVERGARQQLAIAYNNYGIRLAEQGRYPEATQQLTQALSLEPANPQFTKNAAAIHLQAAQSAYQAHQFQSARTWVKAALQVDPHSADAYALLGMIEYDNQRLKEARTAWQKALSLNPQLPAIKERLDQLSQELPVENELEKWSQGSFDIRYTGDLSGSAGYDISLTLQRARREIGSDFAYWPRYKLIVLVYRAEEFRKLRQDLPEWVAGQFDGKIRVPLPGKGLSIDAVTRTLFHEYTHALVHDVAGDRLPTWFNEGLAEYEAWKDATPPWPLLRQAAASKHLIPWSELSNQFSVTAPAMIVGLAYEQSHSIVRFLAERFGFWRIRRVLKAVHGGTPLETALPAELHLKTSRLEEFWRAWLFDTLT